MKGNSKFRLAIIQVRTDTRLVKRLDIACRQILFSSYQVERQRQCKFVLGLGPLGLEGNESLP